VSTCGDRSSSALPYRSGTSGRCARHELDNHGVHVDTRRDVVARSRHHALESLLAAEEFVGHQIHATFEEPGLARPFQVEVRLLIAHCQATPSSDVCDLVDVRVLDESARVLPSRRAQLLGARN
jgi:hypothetical protein